MAVAAFGASHAFQMRQSGAAQTLKVETSSYLSWQQDSEQGSSSACPRQQAALPTITRYMIPATGPFTEGS